LHSNNLTGIDLDKCRDAVTGVIAEWALAIVRRLDSYTEVSPSGTGLRIYARGTKPSHERSVFKGNGRVIEIYDGLTSEGVPGGRFLTVTGRILEVPS
jgi:primase-polymerase (primpol)-like protein